MACNSTIYKSVNGLGYYWGIIFFGNSFCGTKKYLQMKTKTLEQADSNDAVNMSNIVIFSFGKSCVYSLGSIFVIPPCIVMYDVFYGKKFERHIMPGSVYGNLWK